jgi:nitronate monooxygenase
MNLPPIIQGGMGAGVSGWRLARAVSAAGQLGVVSGTGLDNILSRRLQDGDPGGHMRWALDRFPFPGMAQRILQHHFIPGGKRPGDPYRTLSMHTLEGNRDAQELCLTANFAEVTLAREGHGHPVGINYLEKIQLPHLPSLYGAMLAGVHVVIVGAGIPLEVPAVLDALSRHETAGYPVSLRSAASHDAIRTTFHPRDFWEDPADRPVLARPLFLPIVSSEPLARILLRRGAGGLAGFIVEHHTAGGHNAPPRGARRADGDQPVAYGPRDAIDLNGIRQLGLPFWLAGGYGTPERLREALAAGAAGVQVGSAFALSRESGFEDSVRRALLSQALRGEVRLVTDGRASPTGFPFKVAGMADSLSEPAVYEGRRRICDLGFLREAYVRPDGSIGYRCAAEPVKSFIAKGGDPAESPGRKCLCNALVANIGMPQIMPGGKREPCLVTLGEDLDCIHRFCTPAQPDYGADDVVRILLGESAADPSQRNA